MEFTHAHHATILIYIFLVSSCYPRRYVLHQQQRLRIYESTSTIGHRLRMLVAA
jgi:hypothetical protein